MSDFIAAFWLEFAFRQYHYGVISFTFCDVFYCIIILSIIGIFLNHLIGDFFAITTKL